MTKSKILFLLILFIGVFLRLYGNNWDQGWHLHPDERFLTMVGNDVKIPSSFSEYLNTPTSSFNPGNKGHAFYVYGTLPLLINKVLAQQVYSDTYDQFNLLGRVLSGLADFFVIIILYKLIELVEKKLKLNTSIKYLSSFLYAIAVLPIQLSHFFTVDTFLNLFVWASFYFAVKIVLQKEKGIVWNTIFSGLFFGLALACKISAIYFVPLIGIFIFFGLVRIFSLDIRREQRSLFPTVLNFFFGMTLFLIFCYFAVRIGSPYYFETNNVFNPQLNKSFISNIQTLKSFENPLALFPPAIQWLSKSNDFQIRNIIFFGVGPIYFLFAILGGILLMRKKNGGIMVSISWIILFLLYQSFQFAKTMRYLIIIYPFLAISAAVGLWFIIHQLKLHLNRLIYLFISSFIYLIIIVWPVAFMSIYTKDQSRVTASKWMYKTIPQGSTILTEYWDDPLPLMVQDPRTRNFIGREVHIFDPDTTEKWQIIDEQLNTADYYIMSSNRGWGSIPTTPERYPIASQFYKKMLQGKGNYTLEKEFTSYPSLRYLGIPLDFPDQWAEEAFTVYDHPQVLIFKKNKTQ